MGSVGFHRVTMKIIGANSYGWCKGESGVHRLVRLSPFDNQGRRHTSFASVCVFPSDGQNIDSIRLVESDLKIETFRASGNDHVKKLDLILNEVPYFHET
jgi:peptide chain release factor 2